MPLPLPMMIPFMAAQSAALGLAFGESFQYGKRKISAMTNEEFNKLDAETLMMRQQKQINAIIPALKESMTTYTESMTPFILEIFGKMVQSVVNRTMEQIGKGSDSALDDLWHIFGQHYEKGHGTNLNPIPPTETEVPTIEPTSPTPTIPSEPLPDLTIEHSDIIGHEKHPEHPSGDLSSEEHKLVAGHSTHPEHFFADFEPLPPKSRTFTNGDIITAFYDKKIAKYVFTMFSSVFTASTGNTIYRRFHLKQDHIDAVNQLKDAHTRGSLTRGGIHLLFLYQETMKMYFGAYV